MGAAVSRRIGFNSVCIATALVGLAFVAYGMTLPVYTDPEAAQAIKLAACDDSGPIPGWYEPLNVLKTWRHTLIQSGISLFLGAATVFSLSRVFRITPGGGPSTPTQRYVFFLLGYAVLATGWASMIYSLALDGRRGEFAWCADTIAIPAFGLTFFYGALALVCTLVGLVLAYAFGRLPVSLWCWDHGRRVKSAALTAIFGLLALAIAAVIAISAGGLRLPRHARRNYRNLPHPGDASSIAFTA